MMITRFNPFADYESPVGLRPFQDAVNRLFGEPSAGPWTPAVDILETKDELVVKADLPDVELKDINIQIEDGALTLSGERKCERDEKSLGFHRVERSYGSFVRCFSLPESVDTEKVNADYKNGVLSVTLPKKEIAKPRSIKVNLAA
ncbi:MAG: Hsp20/alpha crystallin family protein [Acidobacteriota bacterium]